MNNFLSFQVHGNGDNSVDFLTLLETFLGFLTGLAHKPASDIFASLLPGLAALPNLHPLLVHFPIAFLSSFFLIEFITRFRPIPQSVQLANTLLYLGTFTAIFTVIAGFNAAHSVAHGENVHQIMETHKILGVTGLGLALLLSSWRLLNKGQPAQGASKNLFLLLSAFLCLLISLGADLGGLMVYKHAVAVKAVSESMQQSYQQHQHGH